MLHQQRTSVRLTELDLQYKVNRMTRCVLLDKWFDEQSKVLDQAEKEQKKDLITGEKNDS